MKKIFLLALSVLLILSLFCACSDTPDNPSVDGPDSSEFEMDGADVEVLQTVGTLGIGAEIRGVITSTRNDGKVAMVALDKALVSAAGVNQVAISLPSDPSIVFHAGVGISATIDSVGYKPSLYRIKVKDVVSVQPMETEIPYSAPTHYPDLWEYYSLTGDGQPFETISAPAAVYLRLVEVEEGRGARTYVFAQVPNFEKGEPLSLAKRYLSYNEDCADLAVGDYVKCMIEEVIFGLPSNTAKTIRIHSFEKVTDLQSIYYPTEELIYKVTPRVYDTVSGEILSVTGEGVYQVKVSDAYVPSLGETITLKVQEDYYLKNQSKGTISARIRTIVSTDPYEFVVDNVRIHNEALYVSYLKHDRYSIPAYFPDVSDGVYKGNAPLVKKSIAENFRVIKVDSKVIYLVTHSSGGRNVNAAILAPSKITFQEGDVVRLGISQYYTVQNDNNPAVYLFRAQDVIFSQVLSYEDACAEFGDLIAKPVIYLYPEEDTVCSVKVDLDGKLTCTYPDHGTAGWQNFIAKPDGTLIFPDGREYYCLYWEGKGMMDLDLSRGFCVKGSDTAAFLEKILAEIGLTPREANEFIIYWLPLMQNNEYNLISFQHEAYTSAARLEITPTPDSLLRVYMVYQPLDAPVEIEPQTFEPFERKGFTVVEWGGDLP